jgi:predicted nucleic acid-binding protein
LTSYYIDTSGLAKYYIPEQGTGWMRMLIRPSALPIVVICDATLVEMFSLLDRRRKMGSLTPAMVTAVQASFLQHVKNRYLVEPVDTSIFIQARLLVTKHGLRTLDAVQLSAAVSAATTLGETLTFISADVNLLTAAQAEGLVIDNPNNHP